MKDIIFILSSLSDPHYRRRVEEFIDHGWNVTVYGFKRKGQDVEETSKFSPIIIGEYDNRHYKARLSILNHGIKNIYKKCKDSVCFYSSLDIAIFARLYIHNQYIYEICDLTELTIRNKVVRNLLSYYNEIVIKKSLKTIVTSEGFIEYFHKIPTERFALIPNKLSPDIPPYTYISKKFDGKHIKIGFAGVIRFESIFHFAKVCMEYGRNIELHLFGIFSDADRWAIKIKNLVTKDSNVVYHGKFINPQDLPSIYNNIDLVLCTYTPTLDVKYAEPNKLYEAIYFRCPIIVSRNVYLGEKVEQLDIGYVIDAMDEISIKNFLDSLNAKDYQQKINSCKDIPQNECINNNDNFFNEIKNLIN